MRAIILNAVLSSDQDACVCRVLDCTCLSVTLQKLILDSQELNSFGQFGVRSIQTLQLLEWPPGGEAKKTL